MLVDELFCHFKLRSIEPSKTYRVSEVSAKTVEGESQISHLSVDEASKPRPLKIVLGSQAKAEKAVKNCKN